jgi:diaminopimelate epimerase
MTDAVPIVKLSGAGNDFVALGPVAIRALGERLLPWIRGICRRGLSVGADGALLVEPLGGGRVRVRFHNPDGSPAFCGNGTRCAARFAYLQGMSGPTMILETAIGDVPASVEGDGAVRLELPPPRDLGRTTLDERGAGLAGRRVLAGVPHFVVTVEGIDAAPLTSWGPRVRRHPAFGDDGTNLDLVEPEDASVLRLRTWERGVEGETLACGSGAVAAAFAARLEGAPAELRVVPESGVPLTVAFGADPASDAVELHGDARVIFETTVGAEALAGAGHSP